MNTWESTILNVFALIITILTLGDFLISEDFNVKSFLAVLAIIVFYFAAKRIGFAKVDKKTK